MNINKALNGSVLTIALEGRLDTTTAPELEKSVVSHVADDVKISIEGWQTEMVIVKKLA